MHRSILVVDVAKFADPGRNNADQVAVRDGMYEALTHAFATAGISWSNCASEDRGDGALVLIPPQVPKSWLVTRLPVHLVAALGGHNAACSTKARIRLRMALHAGEIHPDAHGVTGNAINRTFRLIEAPALKSALDVSTGVLALIVSGWFYDEVVRHDPAAEPRSFRHVRAVVKETRVAAWIRIVEPAAGKNPSQAESATGGHPRRRAHGSGDAVALKSGAVLPDRSRLPPPRQLPPSPSGFVGREGELAQLDALLSPPGRRRPRPVVIAAIHGMAGVGKTALAIHWGHRIARRFPDGQLYTDLRGRSPRAAMTMGEALGRSLRALGIPDQQIPLDEEEQAALYRSLLAGRRVLVVLDNAATPEQVRLLLPGSASCMVVVTSRSLLPGLVARDGAQRINLEVLPAAQAVALLAQSVGAARVDAELDAAERLARLCGRLPLALRIAAERVASHPRSALADLVSELTDAHDRLDLLSAGDDDAAAVRAVFSWSYRTLSPDAARVFRLMGLLAGPDVSTQAVAALIGSDTAMARRLLDVLARMYLIQETLGDRYRLHDLLRLYAAERAVAEDTDEDRGRARRRVLDWYLHTADAASSAITPQQGRRVPLDEAEGYCAPLTFSTHMQAVGWYETERANLMASIRLAAETGQHGVAWKLPATLVNFFALRKSWNDWISSHQIGLAAARHIGDRYGEAWILSSLGYAHRDLRRPEEAISYCQQALAVLREIGEQLGQAYALIILGLAHGDLRRFEEAISYCHQALAIFREIGDRRGQATCLVSMSAILRGLRRARGGHQLLPPGTCHPPRIGDRWGQGLALETSALANMDLFRFEEAIGTCGQALSVHRDIGNRHGEGDTLNTLSTACRGMRRFREAIDYSHQALSIAREIGDRRGEGITLTNLGAALRDAGQKDAARRCWREALTILDGLGSPKAGEVRALLEKLDAAEAGPVPGAAPDG